MDNEIVIKRLIDILNSQNSNLLIGNITSPRPGSTCQVSTKYGVVEAYNINCTYPGNAIVIWDKDEKKYYAFTTEPSRVIETKQLVFRKNREIPKPKKTDNYIKILFKQTIGTTVNICVGGCYESPKVLYSYETTGTTQATDFKINAFGEGVNDWIVGFKTAPMTIISGYLGKFYVFEGSTQAKYISTDTYVGFSSNIGRGYFEASNITIYRSPGENTASYSFPYDTFSATYNPPAYNTSTSKSLPNFLDGQIINTTYSGVAIKNSSGVIVSGILGILGIVLGMWQGSGTAINYAGQSIQIRSIFPGSFGFLDGNPINVETYATILVGNNNQYMYLYTYNHNISVFSSQLPLKTYIVSSSYGTKEITNSYSIDANYTNWINNKFTTCSSNLNSYIGSGLKTLDLGVQELQSDASFLSKPTVKAKFYGIPSGVELLGASYYNT